MMDTLWPELGVLQVEFMGKFLYVGAVVWSSDLKPAVWKARHARLDALRQVKSLQWNLDLKEIHGNI